MSCDQTGPKTAGDCNRGSPRRRNRYFRGKQLTVADYQAEQSYFVESRRLINRTMLGWGIAAGFEISQDDDGLTVGKGVALDPCGREVVACDAVKLAAAEDVLWLARTEGRCEAREPVEPAEGDECREYLLSAHYAEQRIDGIRIDDECGDARCEANYLCETVVYSLTPADHCPPGLAACLCNPWDDEWCADFPDECEDLPYVAPVHDRGTHRQLVDWSLRRHRRTDFCAPRKLECVKGLLVDLCAGVPLACVEVGFRCGEAYFGGLTDDWGPKRLARPNDVLFDLIRGCDLVRIVDIGWLGWHGSNEPIDRGEFKKMFEPPLPEESQTIGKDEYPGPSTSHFWIETSGPVQVSSLKPHIFAISLFADDDDEGYQSVSRIVVQAVEHDCEFPGDPPDTTRRFWPRVSGFFYNGEIAPRQATKLKNPVTIQITLDGNGVVDALGQCLDAENRADELPSGNGSPGGLFSSTFNVSPDGKPIPPRYSAALPAPEDVEQVEEYEAALPAPENAEQTQEDSDDA